MTTSLAHSSITYLASATAYTTYGWIGYIILGAIAGWIASKFMGTDEQQGFFLNAVFGVIGGLLGGYLLSLLNISGTGGFIFTLVSSVIGAVILIWIWQKFKK